jgi:hypothetical protein
MQASYAKIRRTPFGDSYGYRPVRSNPFDVHTRERAGTRRAPRLSAAKLAQLRPELDRLDVTTDMLLGSHEAHRERTKELHRALLWLTWRLVRLAVLGLAARLLDKTRRSSEIPFGLRRRRA